MGFSLEASLSAEGAWTVGELTRRAHSIVEAGMPPVTSLLSAPLFYGEEFLGILKMAAWQRPPFGRRDVEVVQRFLPAAAVSMAPTRSTEARFRTRAWKRAAMASA